MWQQVRRQLLLAPKAGFEIVGAAPPILVMPVQDFGGNGNLMNFAIVSNADQYAELAKIGDAALPKTFVYESIRCYVPELFDTRNICRTCYRAIVDGNLFRLCDDSSTSLRDMLSLVLVNIDLYICADAAICLQCKNLLESSYQFVKKWQETEERFEKLKKQRGKDANLVVFPEKRPKPASDVTPEHGGASSADTKSPSRMDAGHFSDHAYFRRPVSMLEDLLGKKKKKKVAPSLLKKKFDYNLKLSADALSKQVKMRDDVPFLCQICGAVLRNRVRFTRHLDKHRQIHKCDRCDYVASYAYGLKTHSTKHAERTLRCEFCPKMFNNKSTLKMHVDYVHLGVNDQIQCHVCGKQFKHRSYMRHHMLVHRGGVVKKYKCEICSKSYSAANKWRAHVHSHTDTWYKCHICNKQLKYEYSLRKHVAIFHENKSKHRCEICNKGYWKNGDLQRHLARGVCNENSKLSRTSRVLLGTDCELCGKVFGTRMRLVVHKRSHIDATFPCSICGKKFKYQKSVETHVEIFHGNRGKYKCELCDKGYWKRNDLLKHCFKFHNVQIVDELQSDGAETSQVVSFHIENV